MTELQIECEDPRRPDVQALIARHVAFGRGQSPPEDAHALDLDGLLDPNITFFTCRQNGELLGMGALKMLGQDHAELKSMHTVEHARGMGIGRAILQQLLAVARARGVRRVSLETGSMEAFAPSRRLYERTGFRPCAPFAGYVQSRHSMYMTLSLEGVEAAGDAW